MTRFATATLVLAVTFRQTVSQDMYPDWGGGSGTCLNHTVTPAENYLFVTASGYLESTLESCCTRYYPNDAYNDCIVGGGGNITGTGDFYALWTANPPRCAADCVTTEGPECGGLLGPGQAPSFSSAATCCAQYFGSLQAEYCAAISNGGEWGGNGKYYLDSTENICVQDCEGVAPCGGVVTQAWVSLYDSIEDCCSNKLPSLDQDHCVSQSTPGSTGTNKWFVDGSVCKKDCEGTGDECGDYSWGTLYADAAACCAEKLSWIQEEYCQSRSDPTTHGVSGEPYTNLWFVEYDDDVCVKDCSTSSGDDTCADIGDGSSTALYTTAALCCSNKLNWIDGDTCEEASLGGSDSTPTGSSDWYADYQSARRCVMDCPEGAGAPTCGGVVSTNGVSKYGTVEECCSAKFQWYQQDLCKALSEAGEGNDAQTGLWYVNYQEEACVKDCPDGSADNCAGNPSSFSEPMYETAAACCSAKLAYVDSDACENKSENGADAPTTGTMKWYADYQGNRCAKDCAADADGDPACSGIVEQLNGVQLFDDMAACCSGKFGWIDGSLCAARSANPGFPHTFKFYPDQQNKVCQQDCAAGTVPCGGAPTELSVALYDTIADCCSTAMAWENEFKCQQVPASEAGSDEFWINWTLDKCVQNCDESLGGACGGLAASWDVTYTTSSACCAQPTFAWREDGDCIKS